MSGYSCVGGIDITLWFAPHTTKELSFLEKSMLFKFVQFIQFAHVTFNRWCFSCGNDKSRTQNLLIPKHKTNCFDNAGLYGQNGYVSLLESVASEFEYRHYHDSSMC